MIHQHYENCLQYESVLDEVRVVLVRDDPSHPALRDLSCLLVRMESRPLALQIWGRDK